jgi:hypothetical protein
VAQENGKGGSSGKGAAGGEGDDFIPPDFDEDAFIHREMVSFRTTLILFVWAIVAAAVSWAAFGALHGAQTAWLLGLGICAVFGYALRWLFPRLKADIAHFGRREWLGTAALFFFTWLAFFILAINPPISDFAPPRVEPHASPALQQAGGAVTLDLFVEDNEKVSQHSFHLLRDGAETAAPTLSEVSPGHFRGIATAVTVGNYSMQASADDSAGHTANRQVGFQVVPQAFTVALPEGGAIDSPTDQVLVKAIDPALRACTTSKNVVNNAPCVRTVRLLFADGRAMDLEWSATFGGWQATSNFAGWAAGPNNFTVSVQMLSSYAGSVRVDGGNLTAGPYQLNVATPIGTYAPKVVAEPTPHQRKVPGLEAPFLAVALVALAVVVRRRR